MRSSPLDDYGKSKGKVPLSATAKRPTKQKKPKDKPKRPLSAYNFFFKEEREKILKVVTAEDPSKVNNDKNSDDYIDEDTLGRLKKEGGKVSFEEMGKLIGLRWKNIDPDRLSKYGEMAAEDTERYKAEMEIYNGKQEAKMRSEALKAPTPSYPAPGRAEYGPGPPMGPPERMPPMQDPYPPHMSGMPAYAGYGPPGMGNSTPYPPHGGMEYAGYGGMGMSMSMGGYGSMNGYGAPYGMPPEPPQPGGMPIGGAPEPYGRGGGGGGYGGPVGVMSSGYQGGGMPITYGGPPPPEYGGHPGMDPGPPPPPHHSAGMYGGYGPGQGWAG